MSEVSCKYQQSLADAAILQQTLAMRKDKMIRPGNLHCNLENSGIFRHMTIVHSLGDAAIHMQILTNMIRQLAAVSDSYLQKDPDPGEL